MTFLRIDVLPRYDPDKRNKARSRWEDEDGRLLCEAITAKIRAGAGEDFLQWDFEQGRLGFLEDYWDLSGIQLFKEEITFPTGDNFENIDFAYGQFWHCKFINATFPQTHFTFTRLYNVEFRNCLFAFAQFYGASLEKCKFVECEFVDENGFLNCQVSDTKFDNCFFNKNKFTDCLFDESVAFKFTGRARVGGLLSKPASGFNASMEKTSISGIYRGIKEGFLAGKIHHKAQHYLFLQQQAYTRFNRAETLGKARAFIWEVICGYGLKPGRVLVCLIGLFLIVFSWFAYRLESVEDGLIFTSGAFLTFGAKADLLQKLSLVDHVVYIASALAGISLIALFITVMANVLLKGD